MTNRKKAENRRPPPATFEEAARRIQEEGEAMPFDEVLRRLVKGPPKVGKPREARKCELKEGRAALESVERLAELHAAGALPRGTFVTEYETQEGGNIKVLDVKFFPADKLGR